jgi:hypothetical protein
VALLWRLIFHQLRAYSVPQILALTAVFGLALNMDLWGKSEAALVSLLSEVSLRYGNVQGGQILRRQSPIQSFLDLISKPFAIC